MDDTSQRNALIFLLLFLTSAVAVPLPRDDKCARHCTESSRFQFTPRNTYIYDYETSTTTTVKGTTNDQSQLQMRAQVDIEVLSKCELSMRLRGVTLKQSDPQSPDYLVPIKGGRDFSRAVEHHVLKFSYQDGVVEHLCPSEDTPTWVTNIHRGVLSAFQNSMKNFEGTETLIEADVAGKCSVEYQSLGRSWRGTLTIRKLKDLNACTDRHRVDTSLQATPFTHGSSIQSTPLVMGNQECEQSIGSGLLQSSTCTEKLAFRPFSRKGNGATTTVNQKLTFSAVRKTSFTGNDYRPTKLRLLYEHDSAEETPGRSLQEAEEALAELCQESEQDITISVPGKFAAFVYRLKRLDYESLTNFYKRVDQICPTNKKSRKFFMDSIPIISTTSAVRFMVDMMSRQEVSQSEANFWFSSLSFVSEPTAEMISTLEPLLDGRFEQAYLGVSSLVHTFCKTNDCSKVAEVRSVALRLIENLGESCFHPDTRKILLALKSVGNIGLAFGRERILEKCYMNPQLKTEVRIAAIQAYRRFSCDVSRDTFLKSYRNYNEQSEIRIASYLAAMQCMSSSMLQTVKETLEHEQVNQVGSFVWTHIQALSKSRHPDRQDLREILSSLYLLNKYNSDIRKFSSAHEASMFLKSIDSGFHVDSHLIFPTHSYVPHSASLNLTVDIFGHSCNILQLDGRLEGMENIMEKFFGPEGYFPQKQVSRLLREKRSVDENKIDKMDREFDAKSRLEEKLYGSLDVKIFGNTMWYSQIEEGDQGQASMSLMDLITELAQKQEKEFTRSFMFLDTNYAVPLSTGLPLRLSLNGTATVGVKVGGKFNVRSFRNVDIQTHLEPSGSIELAGLLTVDAGNVARTGLRIAATMHSSTLVDGILEVRNGEVIKAELNMPRERIDIIDIRSKLYLLYGSDEREQVGHKAERYHWNTCVGQLSRRVLGVELCSDISLPKGERNSPMYPMNGAATFSVYLHKTDPTLTKYTFDATWENKMVNGQTVRRGVFSLNTPQSKIDREVTLQFHLSQPDNTFSLEAKTPVKKIGINAKFVNTKALRKLDLSTTVDGKNTFSVRSELRTLYKDGGQSYFPSLEISLPTKRLFSATGSGHLRPGVKYSAQVSIKDITTQPIVFQGNLDMRNRDRFEGEFSLNSFALDTTVKGFIQKGDTMTGKINAEYRIMESTPYKINVHGKIRDLSASALMKYTGVLNIQATAFPEWDTSVSWETMKTKGHLENTLSFAVGDGSRSRVHTISLQEVISYRGKLNDNQAEVTLKLSYPERNINYALDMKHENNWKMVKNVMDIQYAKNRVISTSVELSRDDEKTVGYSGDMKLKYPGRDARATFEVSEEKHSEYRAAASVQWQRGKRVEFLGHYKDRGDSFNIKKEVDAELSLPNKSPISMKASVATQSSQYSGVMELNLGLDKYRVSGEYATGPGQSHRISGALLLGSEPYSIEAGIQQSQGKFVTNVEVKLPNHRTISSKVDIKNSGAYKTASVDVMWDADRDKTKRFGLDSELRVKSNGYDCKLTTQILRRTVRASISTTKDGNLFGRYFKTMYKGEVEWSPREKITFELNANTLNEGSRCQMTSSLSATTPYHGYESIEFNVYHVFENQQWSSEMSAMWSPNKKCSLSTEGKYFFGGRSSSVESSLKFQSPFQNFELLLLNVTNFYDPIKFSNKIQAHWSPNNQVKTELYHSLIDSGFKCGMKLATSFSHLSDISTEITHSYSNGNYKTKGEFQWAPSKKVNGMVDLRISETGRRTMCSLNVAANTPFRGFESVASKLVYNNDGTTLNTDAEVHYDRKKIAFGTILVRRNSYYNKNVEGKISLTSPFSGYENLQLTTSVQSTTDSYKINFDTRMPHKSSISFNSEGKIPSLHNIELNAVISGKLPSYGSLQRISVDFVHKLQNNDMRSTFDVIYGSKQVTVLLTGSYKPGYKSSSIDGSLLMKTPFRGYEDVKLDFTNTKKDWELMSRLEASINRENALLVQQTNIKDILNIESSFHLTSSMSNMRNVRASLKQFYSPEYFSHTTNVEWDHNNVMDFSVQYQGKMALKELTIKLNTPYKEFKTFDLSATHQMGHVEYKSKLNVLFNNNKIFSFDGTLSDYRMQMEMNVGHLTKHKLTISYDLTDAQKAFDLTVASDESIFSLSSTAQFSINFPKLDVVLNTPFQKFRTVNFNLKGENRSNRKHMSISYERNRKKMLLTGRYTANRGGAEFDVSFTSPYSAAKVFRTSAKYKKEEQGLSSDAFVQWSEEDQMTLGVQLSNEEGKFDINVIVTTPFENYESTKLEFDADTTSPKHKANFLILWGKNEKMRLTSECEVHRGRKGKFMAKFESSFCETISAASEYEIGTKEFEGELKMDFGNGKIYSFEVDANNEEKFLALKMELNTPHTPYRNVKTYVDIDYRIGKADFSSKVVWENKELKASALFENTNGQLNAKFHVNTPFRSFREFSIESEMKNYRNEEIELKLNLKSPFKILRQLNAESKYKHDSEMENFDLKITADSKSTIISGRVSNNMVRPLRASVRIDAPFTSFQVFQMEGVYDHTQGLLNSRASGSLTVYQSTHSLTLNLNKQNVDFNGELVVKSPLLETGSCALVVKVNYRDKVQGEITATIKGTHTVLTTYSRSNQNMEMHIRAQSPFFPQKKMELEGKYARHRQGKNVEAKFVFTVPSSKHELSLEYDNNNRQSTANVIVQSELLPSSELTVNGKYVYGNGRDLEMSLSAKTPESEHSIVTNIKNYSGEKFIQLDVDCPLLPSQRYGLTATLKHDEFTSFDGVLTLSAARKEIRFATNMKRQGWEKVEAFATLNTPFESFSMIRVDGGFKNDRSGTLECTMQLETSHKKFSSIGFTAKLSRTEGSEDMSLMMRLPNRKYHAVQVLGNLHYNADFSIADSRLTLSLPPKRYSVYGRYSLSDPSLAVDGELEWESKKWALSSQFQRQDDSKSLMGTLKTPSQGTYTAGGDIRSSGTRHSMSILYGDPKNQALNVNISIEAPSVSDFNIVFDAITPFENYKRVDFRLKHQRRYPHLLVADVECIINHQRAFLSMYHRLNHTDSLCSVRLGTPLKQMQEVEASLIKFNRGRQRSLEVNYNHHRKFKAEMAHMRGSRDLLLDVPSIPLTITARMKPKDGGSELDIKSNCPTRTMSFKSFYQNSPKHFIHDAALVWDETERKSISYSTRLDDISSDKNSGKEIFARVNFPLRSLELKGSYAQSGRINSGGVNFSWDAARNADRHISVGVEHQDLTNRRQMSHRVKLSLAHPDLESELVQTSIITFSRSEMYLKGELQYSRHQEHNIMAELKASDLSQGHRDHHYKAEMSVHHPVSHLDVRAHGEVADNGDECITHLKFNNINRRRGQSIREIQAKIFRSRRQIDLLMRSNEDQMAMSGKFLRKDDEFSLFYDQKINDRPFLNSIMRLNLNQKSLDVNITKGEKKGLRLSASIPDESAVLKLSHFDDMNEVTDARVFVGLEKSRVLKSRVHWKPGMWRDLRIETGETIRGYSHAANSALESWYNDISNEMTSYMVSIKGSIVQQTTPFLRSLDSDMARVSRDASEGVNYLNTMYRNNEFFMQDVVEGFRMARRGLRKCYGMLSLMYETLENIALEYMEDLYDRIFFAMEDFMVYAQDRYIKMKLHFQVMARRTMQKMATSFQSLCRISSSYAELVVERLRTTGDAIVKKMEESIKSHAPCIIDMYYYVRLTTESLREKITYAVASTTEYVTKHPLYAALNDYWGRAVATIQAFQMADLTNSIQSRILLFGEHANEFMNRLSDIELLDIIRNRLPDPQHVAGVAKATFDKGIEIYTALGLDQVLRTLFDYTLDHMKKIALSSGHELLQEFYELKSGAKYNFDARKGILSFEYRLPSSRSTIYDAMNFAKYPDYKKLNEMKDNFITKYYSDFCMWDVYYRMKNLFNLRQWLPPFTAHAMIAGNQHFVTFDKFSFDFAGECSYLLARDFVDKNFTVLANYKREGQRVVRKSLTVLTEGNKFEVSSDYKVVLNDARVEMPMKVGNTVISREGSTTRIENERIGIAVICNFVHDICTVGMSGYYFAKTGGLFGTYDYEPKLDMMTPERTPASDVEAFANSWEVGKTVCRRDNMATIPGNDRRVQERCKSLFSKTTSQFRSCFKQVNPEIYFKMCVSDLSVVGESDFDSAICTSAAAYFTECNIEGVLLKMPSQCVRCESHQDGKPATEGSVTKFTRDNPTHTADVVFVVEEKECNIEKFKYLGKLAQNIEENFRQKGFRDIRYRVVGFGGNDIHAMPHVHTMDGQDYGTIRSVDLAFKTLEAGNGPLNMLEAMRYAAALDYRPGTTKSFVLIKCSICKTEEKKAEYGEMLRTLLDGDISLHVLMEQKFEMKITSKNTKAKKVIGLDKNFAYTLKDVKDSNLHGDGDLLVQLKVPKDICIPMALEVNGSTFDSQYLTDTKKNTYKKFMDVLARRVVRSAYEKPESTMCCECISTVDGVGKTTCQRCVSAEVANMISGDTLSIYSHHTEPESKTKRRRNTDKKQLHE